MVKDLAATGYVQEIFAPGAVRTENTISPPTKSGYHFLCWLGGVSQGWMGLVYPEYYDWPNVYCWTNNTENVARAISVYCLYMKNT